MRWSDAVIGEIKSSTNLIRKKLQIYEFEQAENPIARAFNAERLFYFRTEKERKKFAGA